MVEGAGGTCASCLSQDAEAGGIGTAGIVVIVVVVCLVLLGAIIYFLACHKSAASQNLDATRKPQAKYGAADMEQESATAAGETPATPIKEYDVQVTVSNPK